MTCSKVLVVVGKSGQGGGGKGCGGGEKDADWRSRYEKGVGNASGGQDERDKLQEARTNRDDSYLPTNHPAWATALAVEVDHDWQARVFFVLLENVLELAVSAHIKNLPNHVCVLPQPSWIPRTSC